jgi:LAS superfamily LD-carboxypeptidase LdcB
LDAAVPVLCVGFPSEEADVTRLLVILSMALALTAPAAANRPKQGQTIVPVVIDPLGAEGDVPWTIHVNGLNVRSAPTTNAPSIGVLAVNSTIAGVYNLVVESDEEWLSFPWNGQTAYASVTGMTRPHPLNVARIAELGNLPYGTELVNRWWGVPISYEPSDLTSMPGRYGLNGTQYRLRREAAEAVMAMIDAAAADGVAMLVMSAYRSGPSQKSIYDNNVRNSGLAQRFSAPPGHSEHQLGSTVDIASPTTRTFITRDSPQHVWLVARGAEFGMRQSYTQFNTAETGYIEEAWHWRYWGRAVGSVWMME